VIRICHKENKGGIYTAGKGSPALMSKIHSYYSLPDKHPTPSSDALFMFNLRKLADRFPTELRDYIRYNSVPNTLLFGFGTSKQLFNWFDDNNDLRWMGKEGFHIVEIDGNIIIGDTQAAVIGTRFSIIREIEIEDFTNKHSEIN
jgi:hypothetical protein